MIILVSAFKNNDVTLDVEASHTITDVKKKIQDFTTKAPDEQKLTFNGKTLADGSTVADCEIHSGDVLCLAFPQVTPKSGEYQRLWRLFKKGGQPTATRVYTKIEERMQSISQGTHHVSRQVAQGSHDMRQVLNMVREIRDAVVPGAEASATIDDAVMVPFEEAQVVPQSSDAQAAEAQPEELEGESYYKHEFDEIMRLTGCTDVDDIPICQIMNIPLLPDLALSKLEAELEVITLERELMDALDKKYGAKRAKCDTRA